MAFSQVTCTEDFSGFWAWDSWKHAVALVQFAPDLAKDQIRTMFDFQNDRGMIADCIFRDTLIENHNWRDTKPPLATWSVHRFSKRRMIPLSFRKCYKLIDYHDWWYRDRDHDHNGLCEYGSTDGTRVAAAWESGMDNAVRFDSAIMIQNNSYGWSLNQESVDLNAYLYKEKLLLGELHQITAKKEQAEKYSREAKNLKRMTNAAFYNDERGYYFDKKMPID